MKYTRASVDKGYTDRLLSVDLTTGKIDVTEISEETKRMFVGGRGYCLKLVADGTNAETRYDSPENVLAIAGGPFCGETAYVGTGKFICGTISPLTASFCDSNVGGRFFALAKLAGFDAISITGKSDKDVMVVIDGDTSEISIIDAGEEIGTLMEAENVIEKWKGDGKPSNVAYITSGVGAENTFFGCVNSIYYDVNKKRCRSKQAGRGGNGTVMREKGLRGVLVKCNLSAANANKAAHPDRVRDIGRKLRGIIKDVDPNAMRLAWQGTTVLLDMMNSFHLLPVNNYQYGMDDREKDISGFVFEKEHFGQGTPDGCFPGCTLACTKGKEGHVVLTGPHKGKSVGVDGPEYETAAAVTNMGVFDIGYIFDFTWYCDEYGVDTIGAGVVMSFLAEAQQRGYLTSEDMDGLDLPWRDGEKMMEFLHAMALGSCSFAKEAGKGIRHMKGWISSRAAKRLGKTEQEIYEELSLFGMECKGLEFSMYITKESLAQQGGYGFALKGPQHDEAWLIAIDQLHKELPTFQHKAVALRWFPLFRTWFNMTGLCKLPWIDVRHPEAKHTELPYRNMPTVEYYVEFVNATLGTEKTIDDLLEESERVYTYQKLVNLRQGFGTREFDKIPLRAMAPVFDNEFQSRRDYYIEYLRDVAGLSVNGQSDAELLSELHNYRLKQYEGLTDAVYEEKGYDAHGIPTDETLEKFGLASAENMEIVKAARERVAG